MSAAACVKGFVLCAAPLLAQTLASNTIQPSESTGLTISTDVKLVILDVSAKDTKGGYVSGLTIDNFQVYDNRKLQAIKHFSHEDAPVTVGLVIDSSGSMRGRRPEVITAALTFIHASNPRDETFVVNFNDTVQPGLPADVPFTGDPQMLLTAMWKGKPEGRTALYDALAYSLDHLEQGRMDKKTLVVVSDGGDNFSKMKWPDLLLRAQESRATIYTIGIFDEDDQDRNPAVLRKLANISGGEYYELPDLDEIVPACRKIAADIRNRYTIAYTPPAPGPGQSARTIKVTASDQDHAHLVVRTRSRYLQSGARAVSIRLIVEEQCAQPLGLLWRLARYACLAIGLGCLSYTAWIYVGQYWHERSRSEAFDKERGRPAPTPVEPFEARLSIPRLGLTTMVEEGVGEDILSRAAGHVPETATPGHPGNVAIAAHRDTLFRALKGIRNRDKIIISTRTKDYDYEVVSTRIVSPDDVAVLAPVKGQNTLTLITCYPFYFVGHAPKRFIVSARQTGSENAGVETPALTEMSSVNRAAVRPSRPPTRTPSHWPARTY